VSTARRRISSILFAVVMTVTLAAPVGAADSSPGDPVVDPPTPEALPQAELDLVTMINRQRTNVDLVAYRVDPDLMTIARDRALVMAANDVMDHTEPDGRKVWDRLSGANIVYYAGGEIIVWNNYPAEYSAAVAVQAWMGSPGHHDAIVSTDYNYAGFGAAISATGKRYYAGLFLKEPDETGAIARFGTISKRSVDRTHTRVTIRWSGADPRLQVMTAGLRYFQVQRRRVGGEWHSWAVTTATRRTITWLKTYDREVRVRARDRAGNWGPWKVVGINL
jgi:uncharacterized protein YkwD